MAPCDPGSYSALAPYAPLWPSYAPYDHITPLMVPLGLLAAMSLLQSDEQILAMAGILLKPISQLADWSPPSWPHIGSAAETLTFDSEGHAAVTEQVASFAAIKSCIGSAELSVAHGDGLMRAIWGRPSEFRVVVRDRYGAAVLGWQHRPEVPRGTPFPLPYHCSYQFNILVIAKMSLLSKISAASAVSDRQTAASRRSQQVFEAGPS